MCSNAALPLLFGRSFGRSAKETVFEVDDEVVDDRGRKGDVGDGEFEVCDLLIFFVGGCCVSVETDSFDTEGR